MSRRAPKPLRNARRNPVQLAEIALNELGMSGSLKTRADEGRLWRVRRGLEYLDNDQANVRYEVARLLVDFGHNADVAALVEGMKALAAMNPEKLAEHDAREDLARRTEEAEALIRSLSQPKRDTRSPLERMIDEACGATEAKP